MLNGLIKDLPIVPNDEICNLIAATYSVSQNAFHSEPLIEYIKENMTIALLRKEADYILIGLFAHEDDANKYIDFFRTALEYEI